MGDHHNKCRPEEMAAAEQLELTNVFHVQKLKVRRSNKGGQSNTNL